MRLFLALPLLGTVAACGSSSGLTPTQDFIQRGTDAEAMTLEILGDDEEGIDGLSKTSRSAMPTTGAAVFNGFSALIIDPVVAEDDDDIVILGDVTLTATFANFGTVTGTADNFVGGTGDGVTPVIMPVSGSIAIGEDNSAIGAGTREANEWNSDYAGSLVVDGETFDISGDLEGTFYGNRPNSTPSTYIKGISGEDQNSIVTNSDGDTINGGFGVIGTNPG